MVTIGFLIVVSLLVLAGVVIERHSILVAFGSSVRSSVFGPLNADKGYEAIVRSLIHCLLVLGVGLVLFRMAHTRPRLAGAAALVLMTLDLAAANSRYVRTVEQSMFDGQPALVRIIEKAEADRDPPVPGPFRVHRMTSWSPMGWRLTTSADRDRDVMAWKRDTIEPKFGINFGIEYTHAIGVAELDDYEAFFTGFALRTVTDPAIAKSLGINAGEQVVYYTRRAYDMWNTRYFVVPSYPNGWRDPMRGSAGFVFASEMIYPEKGRFDGPNGQAESQKWVDTQDFRVLRNGREFPRSWVVHSARAIDAVDGLSRERRDLDMREILYSKDPFWQDPTLTSFDPHVVAWVNRSDLAEITPKLSGRLPSKSESVKVRYPNPQRAILEVTLESAGLVILSDVDYPGWQLTIDDKPAPIIRVNILMRGRSFPPAHIASCTRLRRDRFRSD